MDEVSRGSRVSSERPSVSVLLQRGQNNLDLIRLLAAIGVMFGHSFYIQPAQGRHEPIARLIGIEYSGSLAVYTFFLISGMLVTNSFIRQQSTFRFAAHRIARVFPGLIVCVFISAYALYPMFSNLTVSEVIASKDSAQYFARGITFYPDILYTLPHIFENAPLKNSVNGSLWTIPVELKCYLIVLLAGCIGLLRSKFSSTVFIATCGAFLGWMIFNGSPYSFLHDYVTKAPDYSFYPVVFFLIGMLLYSMRETITIDGRLGIALIALYALFAHSMVGSVLFYVAFVYGVLCIAADTRISALRPKSDYSYGVYLWAFPIQQIFASLYPKMDNLLGLMLSIPVTLVMAALSWHLIERPCIIWCRSMLDEKRTTLRA
ncbi:acyltransferase [Burkholderia cepacia]|uniref:acyltransferase family protein n=1 Tax=Burkholderia cepacia TaxID=292 RepID=UPI001CF4DA84|nr:acyltransferase [Burkholderia cepacia]MCA7902846.1 acyltransferase [Burkholderia cepacia]